MCFHSNHLLTCTICGSSRLSNSEYAVVRFLAAGSQSLSSSNLSQANPNHGKTASVLFTVREKFVSYAEHNANIKVFSVVFLLITQHYNNSAQCETVVDQVTVGIPLPVTAFTLCVEAMLLQPLFLQIYHKYNLAVSDQPE